MSTASMGKSGSIFLSPEQGQAVRDILSRVLQGPNGDHDLHAWVFGARADLADAFEASNLPFRVDVVEASRLSPGIAPRVLAERLPLM
jgi:hypothetical protein